jgi:hypothetical protein
VHQKAFELLTVGERNIFRSAIKPAEIIAVLEKTKESKSSISRLSRLNESVAQPFLNFGVVIDTVVQLNPGIAAPIWAPIRVILDGRFQSVSLDEC